MLTTTTTYIGGSVIRSARTQYSIDQSINQSALTHPLAIIAMGELAPHPYSTGSLEEESEFKTLSPSSVVIGMPSRHHEKLYVVVSFLSLVRFQSKRASLRTRHPCSGANRLARILRRPSGHPPNLYELYSTEIRVDPVEHEAQWNPQWVVQCRT